MAEQLDRKMIVMEDIFKRAAAFVAVYYAVTDNRDKGIKILATMNQIIELMKMDNPDKSDKFLLSLSKQKEEQKGQ